MIRNVSNLRYYNQQIYFKIHGAKNVISIPFKRKFFSTVYNSDWKENVCKITKSSRVKFITGEPLYEIIPEDDKCYEDFKKVGTKNLCCYDLSGEYQYIVYEGVEFTKEYDVAYFDIENDDDLDVENANSPIFLLGVWYKGEYKYWDYNEYGKNEYQMLTDFCKWLTEDAFPDVIFGWNVIDFDKKYLVNRIHKLGVNYNWFKFSLIQFIDGIAVVDKKYGYSIVKDAGSRRLHDVSMYFLGRGKRDTRGMTPGEFYKKDYEEAKKYHVDDVLLTRDLDPAMNAMDFMIKLQNVSGAILQDCFFNSVIIDTMILKKYPQYSFPTIVWSKNDGEGNKGGHVFLPKKRLYRNVAIIDFRSQYPSIFMTFNISPETKTAPGMGDFNIDGVWFKLKPDGIFKEMVKTLFNERVRLKNELKNIQDDDSLEYRNLDSLQSAYKTILNSVYGVCSFINFRLYDLDLAESITSMGRKLLKAVKLGVENSKLGYVRYGDTDSDFVEFGNRDPYKVCEAINKFIIPEYLSRYNVVESTVEMEVGKVFDEIAFFGKKKCYVAKIKGEDKYYIKGFDTEKGDTPPVIRNLYKDMIRDLFDCRCIDIPKYIEKIKLAKFQELVMPKRFNMPKDQYVSAPQHLKALRWSERNMHIKEETKYDKVVQMVYVKIDKDVYTKKEDWVDAIVVDEIVESLPVGVSVDYDKYITMFLIDKMSDLYNVFGVDYLPYFKDEGRSFNRKQRLDHFEIHMRKWFNSYKKSDEALQSINVFLNVKVLGYVNKCHDNKGVIEISYDEFTDLERSVFENIKPCIDSTMNRLKFSKTAVNNFIKLNKELKTELEKNHVWEEEYGTVSAV